MKPEENVNHIYRKGNLDTVVLPLQGVVILTVRVDYYRHLPIKKGLLFYLLFPLIK